MWTWGICLQIQSHRGVPSAGKAPSVQHLADASPSLPVVPGAVRKHIGASPSYLSAPGVEEDIQRPQEEADAEEVEDMDVGV